MTTDGIFINTPIMTTITSAETGMEGARGQKFDVDGGKGV